MWTCGGSEQRDRGRISEGLTWGGIITQDSTGVTFAKDIINGRMKGVTMEGEVGRRC